MSLNFTLEIEDPIQNSLSPKQGVVYHDHQTLLNMAGKGVHQCPLGDDEAELKNIIINKFKKIITK